MKILTAIGDRFGRLVAIGEKFLVNDGKASVNAVRCRCDCGGERDFLLHNLARGRTKSCGCVKAEKAGDRALKWGKLVKPPHCQFPGCRDEAVNAHRRKGYAKEFWLDAQRYCDKHHTRVE